MEIATEFTVRGRQSPCRPATLAGMPFASETAAAEAAVADVLDRLGEMSVTDLLALRDRVDGLLTRTRLTPADVLATTIAESGDADG